MRSFAVKKNAAVVIRQIGLGNFSALAKTSSWSRAENVPMEGMWGLPENSRDYRVNMNRQQSGGAIYYAESAQKSSATPM